MRRAGRHVVPGREWLRCGARNRIRNVLRRTLILCVLALAVAAPAGAGNIVVKLGLAPGKLSVASAPAKVAAGSTVAIPVKVSDGRGNGKGWTLRFASGSGLAVVGITAKCAARSTCTLPGVAAGPSGTRVLQAAHDSGMGIIDLVVTVKATATTSVAFSVA